MKKLPLSLVAIFAAIHSFAQSYGTGADGTQTISGTVNKYAAVQSLINGATSATLALDTASYFQVNDLALIIQMQGAKIDTSNTASYGTITSIGSTGNYEYVQISAIAGNLVTTSKLKRSYDANGKVQLVRMPQYQNATINGAITGKTWNGNKGGIIAIDATGTITMNAPINATGIGFRGGISFSSSAYGTLDSAYLGPYMTSPNLYASKGEGIAGYGGVINTCGRGAPGNGGGGGDNHNGGGGGGGNITCGGMGGYGNYQTTTNYNAGGIGAHDNFWLVDSNKIFLGGGGGAGHANDNMMGLSGNGGGIILISTGTIVSGIDSINASGTSATMSGYDGACGGGAGGTIVLSVRNYSNLHILARGGNGGNATPYLSGTLTAPGGGGSGGVLRLRKYTPANSYTYDNGGGVQGFCNGNPFGTTESCLGVADSSLQIVSYSNPAAIATAGAISLNISCYPIPVTTDLEVTLSVTSNNNAFDLTLINSLGQLVYNTTTMQNHTIIPMASLPNGIYILKVGNNGLVQTRRIIKNQ